MGELILNHNYITDISINRVTETTESGYSFDVIYLEVNTEDYTLKYRICGDTRFTINYIENKLNKFKDEIINSDCRFGINEYLERDYIFVTYPNGDIDQYTAQKISK